MTLFDMSVSVTRGTKTPGGFNHSNGYVRVVVESDEMLRYVVTTTYDSGRVTRQTFSSWEVAMLLAQAAVRRATTVYFPLIEEVSA